MDIKKEFEQLVDLVVREEASDLHLTVGRYPSIRVGGTITPLVKHSILTGEDTRGILESLVSEENFKKFLTEQEIDFSYTDGVEKARFRGNAFFQQGFVGIALRLVPSKIKTLKELNLPPVLEHFTKLQQGFFLVVGPVGQGKSTTLASLVDLINKTRAEHIVTIEDPIEYLFKPELSIVDQREVGVDTQSFQIGLESMFRQDIDVIMVGEMRDLGTMSTAVTAAETGHLVFSTLHTNNASQTIDRIIDSFPAYQQDQIRLQLSQSLAGIFSQRLLPRISGGLIPAYELLFNNIAVSNLIREGRTQEINLVIETGSKDGMIDLNRALADLVRRGEVTAETALSRSVDPNSLKQFL